jgi:hypothetical protein
VTVGSSRELDLHDVTDLAKLVRRLSEIALSNSWTKVELLEAIVVTLDQTENAQKRRYAIFRFGQVGAAGLLIYVGLETT